MRIQEERRHCEKHSDDKFAGSEFGRTKCARRADNRMLPVDQPPNSIANSLRDCRVGLRPPRNDIGYYFNARGNGTFYCFYSSLGVNQTFPFVVDRMENSFAASVKNRV